MANTKTVSSEELQRQRAFCDRIREWVSRRSDEEGREITAYTETFGCQQNENDTERINGMLTQMGFAFVADPREADFVLYNTCAVRDHAEQKVYGKVGALSGVKKRTGCIVALCGCMVQQSTVSETIQQKYRQVDLLFGPHALYRFPENLWTVLSTGKKVFDNAPSDGNIAEGLPVRRADTVRAWVSVASGCNNFCSYCIVPYVRGRERSRKPEDILAEVRDLIGQGYKEITLLGQNVNSYGKDLACGVDFPDLLCEIDRIPGDFRIRFMTSHPKDASEKLIDAIARSRHVERHIHLPFQSGSNRILKLMNRGYTREAYLDLVRRAKEKIPDVTFTSDVIVGFPTETEEDFLQTVDLIRQVEFEGLYTFIYSPRNGTPAATMDGQISSEVKKDRYARLSALQSELSEQANARCVGSVLRVMVTGRSEKYPEMLQARTDRNKIVLFPSSDLPEGTECDVKITRALNWAMFGEVANLPEKGE